MKTTEKGVVLRPKLKLAVCYQLVYLVTVCHTQGPVKEIQAILKSSAVLPCDIRSPVPDDAATLVLWYRQVEENPVYSFDNRRSPGAGSHWKDDVFGSRAFFRTVSNPATLSLENVQLYDEGYYRCRVDFFKSPTRNQKIHLRVIVPSSEPLIFDEMEREISTDTRPYEEGATMRLTCLTYGGHPPPVLRWWHGERLLEAKSFFDGNITSSTLIVTDLRRSHYKATYTCQTSNNNITMPFYKTVTVNMFLKPLLVRILNDEQQLSAGVRYRIECEAIGSVPPAKITWWKNNGQVPNDVSTIVSSDGNHTMSILTLTPTKHDHNGTLTCVATNPVVKSWKEETFWFLDVSYPPEVHLSLGPQLNPDNMEEGSDVYFECKINSNPHAYKVVWKHNGNIVHQNLNKNEIMANDRTLVLRNITRTWNGNYTCTASNVEGDKESNVLQLQVLYKPVCKPNQKSTYGAAYNEDIPIICEVDAVPEPEVFVWTFNHSKEPISRGRNSIIDKKRGISILTFTPYADIDFGFLECTASNRLGPQSVPCVFNIIKASAPLSPSNCSIGNVTTVSLDVTCVEGFNGGLTQQFVLQIINATTGKVLLNHTSNFPIFRLNRLSPGNSIRMNIYAENSKGKSNPFVLEGSTLKAEKQTGNPGKLEISPAVGIMVFALGMITLAVFLIICTAKCAPSSFWTASRRSKPAKIVSANENLFEKDDKEPDIIPATKGSGYQILKTESLDEEQGYNPKLVQDKQPRNSRNFDNLVPVMEASSEKLCSSKKSKIRKNPLNKSDTLPLDTSGRLSSKGNS